MRSLASPCLFFCLLILLLAPLRSPAQGQFPDSVDGMPAVRVDSVLYWVHQVNPGETLYSISRKYGVTVGDIVNANPDLLDQIAAGASLRIPIPEEKYRAIHDVAQRAFSLHIVQAGETLYGLARRYGVDVQVLRDYNRLSSDQLKEHAVLRIPSKSTAAQMQRDDCFVHVVQEGESYYGIARRYGIGLEQLMARNALATEAPLAVGQRLCIPGCRPHTLQPGETLYSIARQYGMTVEDIYRSNQEYRTMPLVPGGVLCIPTAVLRPGAMDTVEAGTPVESTIQPLLDNDYQEPSYSPECDGAQPFPKTQVLRCALILPLSRSSSSSEHQPDLELVGDTLQRPGNQFSSLYLDFYRGTLLALESFKLAGYSVELTVFDTKSDPLEAIRLASGDDLRDMDLIVGPVYPKEIAPIAAYAAQHRINMVSPLAEADRALASNPFLFQAHPSFSSQLHTYAHSIRWPRHGKLLLVREQNARDVDMSNELQRLIEQRLATESSGQQVDFRTVMFQPNEGADKVGSTLSAIFQSDDSVTVVVASHNQPFVSTVLGQLNRLRILGYNAMTIYGMQKWMKMPTLDYSYLIALGVKLFAPFYVDYNDRNVCYFVQNYRRFFYTEPTQFAFQAYDVFNYFLRAIYRYGLDFRYCLAGHHVEQLQNRWHFVHRYGQSAYENDHVFILEFSPKFGLTDEATMDLYRAQRQALEPVPQK